LFLGTNHSVATPIVRPSLVVTNDTGLNITSGRTRTWLVTVALTASVWVISFFAKLIRHSTKAVLTAADIQWALSPSHFCIFAAFGVGITV
jgi:hypothetical protein